MSKANSESGQNEGHPPFVIIDDSNVLHEAGGWSNLQNVDNAYNGTLSSLLTSSWSTSHNFSFTFRGTELRLVGQGSADLKMNYSLNAQPASPAQVNKGAIGKNGAVIWSLDGLSPFEETTVQLAPYEGELHLDYIAYKPVDNHVEQGDIVALDNAHPYVVHHGKDRDGFIPVANASTAVGVPFGGTWSRSSKVGSSLSTTFRGGARVAVYGVLNYAAGNLTLQYTLDNSPPVTVQHFDSTHVVNDTKWLLGSQLYERTLEYPESRQNHKLEVKVLECSDDQAFYFDFITYQAEGVLQSTTPPSDTDIGLSTDERDFGDDSSNQGRFNTSHIGAIVGAVFGIIIFTWAIYRFLHNRQWQIRKPPSAQSALVSQNPQTYALQMLAERRREEALRGFDAPEAPPPWSPPQNPEGAPPPPEFEPPPPSDLFPMPSAHVRSTSPSTPGVPIASESQPGPPSAPLAPLPIDRDTHPPQQGEPERRAQDADNPSRDSEIADSAAAPATNAMPPPSEQPPAYTS